MNIAESFAQYMVSLGLGTLGSNMFIGSAPLDTPDPLWWVIASGGGPLSENQTGEMQKNYVLSVYYRSLDAKDVYDRMHDLEETINLDRCTQLEDFDTIDLTATQFATDTDLDNEDRTVGLLQVTIRTYK